MKHNSLKIVDCIKDGVKGKCLKVEVTEENKQELKQLFAKPFMKISADDLKYVEADVNMMQDFNSMYPHFSHKDKSYAVVIDDQVSLILADVETIKFDGGNLNMYNATGDLVGHFRKDHYRYFYKIGL